MISPSPTQLPPTQIPTPISEYQSPLIAEHKPVRATPVKRRIGETRTARILKAILRPPLKILYYLSSWTQRHRVSSLGIILLLLLSIGATTYYLTGELPFGIQHDPFNFAYDGGKGEGTLVQSWLYALRDGDTTHLQLLDKDMSQPPDPSQLVAQFSQTKTHLTWGEANVIAVHQEQDMTVDSFVQIPLTAKGPGSTAKGMALLHFVTASANGQNVLLGADVISLRALQS
jgi:hypothetical protein